MPIFSDDNDKRTAFYEQLQRREAYWWQTRQQLTTLQEQHLFWFGDNSFIMWLLWLLVSYVIVAIVLMLIGRLFDIELLFWHYAVIFGAQTLGFIGLLFNKGRFANHTQQKIDDAIMASEEALQEMYILASDSIFPDIHAQAPISLQDIHSRYQAQLRLSSLQCLLQKEIDAGRLLIGQDQAEVQALPPELADDDLAAYANNMIYKSVVF